MIFIFDGQLGQGGYCFVRNFDKIGYVTMISMAVFLLLVLDQMTPRSSFEVLYKVENLFLLFQLYMKAVSGGKL